MGKVDVILGLQWGDEGKGKIVDAIASEYNIVARFQGGPNAGHTLIIEGNKFVMHTIPSGIFRQEITNLIGNGVVIDPITFKKEIGTLEDANIQWKKNLLIAQKAHLILPTHRFLDKASENAKGKDKIGSTLKGIGPAYMDKTGRNGIRIGDISLPNFKAKYQALKEKHLRLLKTFPPVDFDLEAEEKAWFKALEVINEVPKVNCPYFLNNALKNGQNILAEGAQGAMLDIDFGTFPFVTSSNTVTAGVSTGLGIAPNKINDVIGIMKAYCTRVGSGPFPTELFDEDGAEMAKVGHEFGATTGRPRRCGWLDLAQVKYTCMIAGVTKIAMTKIDVLNGFKTIKTADEYNIDGKITQELPYNLDDSIQPVLTGFDGWVSDLNNDNAYDSLPENAKKFVVAIEKYLDVPISYISTGPERKKLILR